MQLHSVLFAGQFTHRHARMADVLSLSARENSPQTPLTIHEINQPDDELRAMAYRKCRQQWIDNARKAKHHNQIIQEAKEGDVLCMLDSDTIVLGDLSEVESMDFDIAYTVRPPQCRWKLNTGVYFVRATEQAKRFCHYWYVAVQELLKDQVAHEFWKTTKSYGGIHQAALGNMMEGGIPIPPQGVWNWRTYVLALPCETWNCVSFTWDTAQNPKIVHIMGNLREVCFNPKRKASSPNMQRWVDAWRSYDQRCREVSCEVA